MSYGIDRLRRSGKPVIIKAPPESKGTLQLKVLVFAAGIVVLFAALTIQLIRLQILRHDEFELRAATNRLRLIDVPAERGLIFSRNGTLLAENVPGFAATIVPADVPEEAVRTIAEILSPTLEIQAFEIETRILEGKRSIDPFQPVVLQRHLDPDLVFELETLQVDLPGVRVGSIPERHYPLGSLLAHLLGHVGPITEEEFEQLRADRYRLADSIGQTGVEASYETLLRGVPGREQVEVNASGRVLRALDSEPPTPGQSLVLTIDLELQRQVEAILADSMGGSLFAAAAIVDIHNGEILALVSLPTYDNNIFSEEIAEEDLQAIFEDEARPLVNHAVADQFPPGSIQKVVTGAAALEEGVIDARQRIRSLGAIEVQNVLDPRITYIFRDTTAGDFDFVTGLAESSNVYFWYLAGGSPFRRAIAEELLTPEQQAEQKALLEAGVISGEQDFEGLGIDRLAFWARAFGQDEATGIDLGGEASGFIPDSQWKIDTFGEGWGQGDSYNFGIGQGFIAVTPLQMLMVTAAIANGGNLLEPHVVRSVLDSEGNVGRTIGPTVRRRLEIDPANLALVREGMAQSVLAGTSGNAYFAEMQIAGKTGTAEFGAEPTFRDLLPTHGWFIGFAPYNEPRVAVVVFHELGAGFLTAETGGLILKTWAELSGSIDPANPAPPQRATLGERFVDIDTSATDGSGTDDGSSETTE